MGKLNTPVFKTSDLKRATKYQYRPVLDRVARHQTIRERAEFLAHEIFHDRLVPEEEIAEAIEVEIRRFAGAAPQEIRTPVVAASSEEPGK